MSSHEEITKESLLKGSIGTYIKYKGSMHQIVNHSKTNFWELPSYFMAGTHISSMVPIL